MSDNEEKVSSPFDTETDEEETIALSKDELDDILSEAEIVDEKKKTQPSEEVEIQGEESPASEEGPTVETFEEEEEEFDISGEIDELTAEDLEKIELEETDLESFTEELEGEFGEEPEISESPEVPEASVEEESTEIKEEIEGIDTGPMQPETGVDEEIDLDTYLDSVESEIDLDSLDLEGESELIEPPILGEEEEVSLDLGEEEGEGPEIEELEEGAFAEAEEGLEAAESTAETGERTAEEEVTLMEPGGEEKIIPEEPVEEFGGGEEEEELGFEGEIKLDEEEEKILNEDFDLETIQEETEESEEVVSVTGEELESMSADAESAVIDSDLLKNITSVLRYMDTLLGNLPEEKIKEFSQSEYFPVYKDVFDKLNLTKG